MGQAVRSQLTTLIGIFATVIQLLWTGNSLASPPVTTSDDMRKPVHTSTEFDPERTEFYLLTVGLGPKLEARYGHTILQVADHKNQRSHYLNWGTFDFADPMLPLNFFLGRLKYWLSDSSHNHFTRKYRFYEKRPVFRQKIHLSTRQKALLLDKVTSNLRPENTHFWYHFFYRNCSTFPRDMINEVTGGAVEKILSDKTSTTFRYYVRNNLSTPLYASFFLDILMNSTIDFEISRWQESFYPTKLSKHLSDIPAHDEHGHALGGKLLGKPEPVFGGIESGTDPLALPYFISALLVLLFLGLVFTNSRLISVLWSGAFVSYLIISAILGLTMVLAWLFSEHEVLKHNANLWLFWPIDIVAISFLWRRAPTSATVQFLARAHLVALSIASLGWVAGLIDQDIGMVLSYTIPAQVVFYGAILYPDKFPLLRKES